MKNSDHIRSVQDLIQIGLEHDLPLDTVQAITCFNSKKEGKEDGKIFFTGGWDGVLRSYAIVGKNVKQISLNSIWSFYHPIISLDIKDHEQTILVGLANGQIYIIDVQRKQLSIAGYHDSPICNAFWLKNKQNIFISFGFDKQMKVWNQNNRKLVTNEIIIQGIQFDIIPANVYSLPFKTMGVSYNHPNIAVGCLGSGVFMFSCQSFGKQIFAQQLSKINHSSYHKLNKFGELNKIVCIAIDDGYCAVGGADGTVCICSINRNSDPTIPLTQKFVHLSLQNEKAIMTQKKGKFLGQVNTVQFGQKCGKTFLIVGGTYSVANYDVETLHSQVISLNSTQHVLMDVVNRMANKSKNKKQEIQVSCTKVKWWNAESSIILSTGQDWIYGLNGLEKPPKKVKLFVKKIEQLQIKRLSEKQYN